MSDGEEPIRGPGARVRPQHEAFFELSTDLLGTATVDGEFLRTNPMWEERLGYPMSELVGRSLVDLVHPDDVATTLERLERVRKEGGIHHLSNRYKAADDTYRRLHWRFRREPEAVIAFAARDLSEQFALELALRRAQERMENFVKLSGVGGWELDIADNAVRLDAQTKRIHEIDPDAEVALEEALNFYPLDVQPIVTGSIDRALADRAPYTFEAPFITAKGRRIWVRSIGHPVVEDDKVVRLVGAFMDITAQKDHEQKLERARAAAEQASIAKSRFLANMSHEIRTPMAGVLGMLGEVLEHPLHGEQRGRVLVAKSSAEALLQILNDILDYSKLEANELTIERITFEVRRLVEEVHQLLEGRAEEKGIRLRTSISDDVPNWVCTDPTRLRQVLLNLVGNAVKFTEEGEISVNAHYLRGILHISIEDTGIGMNPDALSRVFRRFAQADDSTTRRFGGTGLGLSISKQLVELLGGELLATSKERVGSKFSFSIDAPGAAPSLSARPEQEPVTLPPLRILAAEDNRVNQMVLGNILRRGGHTYTIVSNGLEAVNMVKEDNFDLVLMDVQMPILDGVEATRAIRALEGTKGQIPIVALTANAMVGDRETYLRCGMDEYASKPVHRGALDRAIARALGLLPKSNSA